MTTIAVDLGGSRIKTALIHDGVVQDSAIIPIDAMRGVEHALTVIEPEIARLRGIREPVGIGLAFPGLVDPFRKAVISVNGKFEDAPGFSFTGWAREQYGLPLVLENDANAALVGELQYGCGMGCDNAVLMILGTGIGTAAMLQGHLLRGKHFQAGCLGGHLPVASLATGRACTCGSRGCAEAVGGTWALAGIAGEHKDFANSALSREAVIDYEALFRLAEAGDALATELLAESIDAWSTCAVGLIHAYDPDMLILSGGVTRAGARLTKPIGDSIEAYAWTPWGKVALRVAQNPEHSVLLGVHHLLIKEMAGE